MQGLLYSLAQESLQSLEAKQRVAYNAFRDHAILSVLVFTGIRRGELLNLKVSDVDFATGTLRVTNGKGRKTRVVPLVAEAAGAVSDWLTFRRTKGHDYLFTTVRGNRIYASRLQVIWKAVLGRSGVSRPGVTLHTLRHSMATLLMQSGQADLVAIQHLLGHTRLDTTGIYLHVVPGQLRSAVEAHPLCGAGAEGHAVRGEVAQDGPKVDATEAPMLRHEGTAEQAANYGMARGPGRAIE